MEDEAGLQIAITGGNGFIGQRLIEVLKKDPKNNIRIFDRSKDSLDDIESLKDLVNGCDVIYHLAGIVTSQTVGDLFKVNVLGSQNLIQATSKFSPGAHFIFPSTFAVYRSPNQGEIVDEDFPKEPRNEYGKTKLEAEKLLEGFTAQNNIKLAILRLANVYGPGIAPFRHSVIATWFDQFKNHVPITIDGDGSQTRDFVFVDDVINAFMDAANVEEKKVIVNICSGQDISLKNLLTEMSNITGLMPKITYSESTNSSGGYWKGSRVAAQKLLGWKPQISINRGLSKTWESLK